MDGISNRRENCNPTGGPHVQGVLRAARDELRTLLQQRAGIMKRIGTVKQTILGLANMFGGELLSDDRLELVDRKSGGRQLRFTKACRMVVIKAERPLGTREVCEHIRSCLPQLLQNERARLNLGPSR